MTDKAVWLLSRVRTPFARVDGGLAARDAIALGVPVLQAMAQRLVAGAKIDVGFWGTVIPSLRWSNIARETWPDAGLDPSVPTSSVVMACSTSMMAAFDAAGLVGRGVADLALAGGAESMTHVQIGLSQGLSDVVRRTGQARTGTQRWKALGSVHTSDVKLHIPRVANRTSGKSMGEHSEETNMKALDSPEFLREKVGVTAELGKVPRDRLNPTGGSVALGHPFAATGARILSQAIKALAAMPAGSRVCADGGVGTVCLLEV